MCDSEGSAGNPIRVTAQLSNAGDGYHLWSERHDREMTDVFAVQDEISQSIADRLKLQRAGGKPVSSHQPANIEAYHAYLKGRYHFCKLTPQDLPTEQSTITFTSAFGHSSGVATRCLQAASPPSRMRLCSGSWACCGCGMCILADFRELVVKSVGEPDAGNPHVRFDDHNRGALRDTFLWRRDLKSNDVV